jgi:hypothetical protein
LSAIRQDEFAFVDGRTSSYRSPVSRAIDWAILAIAAALFVVGHVTILMRTAALTTPVYPSDEYGHWANARFFGSGLTAHQFDPNLPGMNNYLFFLVTEWIARAPEGAAAMRMLNYMFVALSAIFVWRLASIFVSRPLALLAAAFVFTHGFTVYSVSTIPETMFMCIVLGLALFMALAWMPRRPLASLAAGLLVGALMLVKPHGVAIFLATAATMIAVPFVLRRPGRAFIDAAADLSAFVAGTLVAIITIASIAQGKLVLSPGVIVGAFYGGILSPSGSGLSFAAVLNIARYFVAHSVVWLLFFAPAALITPVLAWLLLGSGSGAGDDAAKLHSLLVLALFAVLCALGTFAMVSVFTHVIGIATASEGGRIHGRYWGFLVPLFVTVTIALFALSSRGHDVLPRVSRWLERGAGAVWLVVIAVFALVTSSAFAIYPWDFPELFAFYRPLDGRLFIPAWLPSSFWILTTLLAVCASAYLLSLPARRLFYAATLAALFAISNIKTTAWQMDYVSEIRPLVDAAQAATRIVGRQSEGLFVAPEYWGRAPYVMFQLPLRTFVAIKPANVAMKEADVPPSARWVLTMTAYPIEFRYTKVYPLASLTLYLRGTEP